MAYERAGRSGGATKTATDQGVAVDFVSQKPIEIRGNPGCLSHSREALLRVAFVQLPRLSAEDRAGLRKYVERDMER